MLKLSPEVTLSIACLLAVIYATAELTARLARNALAGLIGAAALAAFAPLGIWAVQGADSIALALVTVAASLQLQSSLRHRAPRPIIFATLALGVIVRLDFVVTYILFWLFVLVALPGRKRTCVHGLGILGGTVGAVLLFGSAYYGDPLPNTYYLKTTGIPIGLMIQSGWASLTTGDWGLFAGPFKYSIALFVVAGSWLARRDPVARLLASLVLFAVAYFVRIGGDWFLEHFSRFLVPVVPLYVALIVAGIWDLVGAALSTEFRVLRPVIAWALVPVLAATMNKPNSLAEWWAGREPMLRSRNIVSVEYARHLTKYTRDDTFIGVFWAGMMPYHCPRRMLDLLGKTDAHIAKTTAQLARSYWPGHAKRDWDYVFRVQKPDILLAEMPEMQQRSDYRAEYCVPTGRYWLSVRRSSLGKVTFPGAACPPEPASSH